MMFQARVPTIILEEHHEAFYVWNYAIDVGWMPPIGNTLVHVDEHSDLSPPILRKPLHSLQHRTDIAKFTYDELSIGNFIWPAVFQKIFSRMFWIRYPQPSGRISRIGSVWPKDPRELEFRIGWHNPEEQPTLPIGVRSMEVTHPKPSDIANFGDSFVLDIDLDYFASNKHPRGAFELEVTPSAYEEVVSDPYHFLRLLPQNKISAKRRGESFFIVFNDYPSESDYEIDQKMIDQKMEALNAYLAHQQSKPLLVTLARSVRSGYTPLELAAFIETRVLELLGRLDIETCSISDLLPKG